MNMPSQPSHHLTSQSYTSFPTFSNSTSITLLSDPYTPISPSEATIPFIPADNNVLLTSQSFLADKCRYGSSSDFYVVEHSRFTSHDVPHQSNTSLIQA